MSSVVGEIRWQCAIKNAIRDSSQLCQSLDLDPSEIELSGQGEQQFPVFVPLEFLSRMKVGDPLDPLLLQVLPRAPESLELHEFVDDPVGDAFAEKVPGLLHKYHGRVLLILSGACAIHCRYCFRRHYPYSAAPKNIERWQPALNYIQNDESLHEVILSGGDPLTVPDAQLARISNLLDEVPQLQRLRIHTRLPVVIPQRVDDRLCEWLSSSRLNVWIVLHINHANEIDQEVIRAIQRLKQTGATLLNQSVLMRNVNDNVDQMQELCERLINNGVVPYYLHQLDRVRGATHFEVAPEVGVSIVKELAKRLPGFAVPKYVQELPGEPHKTEVRSLL
jgi:EF-P beta-lysylation protein EpmB